MQAGRPDVVAVKGNTAVIVDCKTGALKTSDSLQVRLYVYLLSEWSTHPARACSRVLGKVRYQGEEDGVLRLPHAASVAGLMRRYMNVFLNLASPLPVLSYDECSFCELGRFFSPDRIEVDTATMVVGLF